MEGAVCFTLGWMPNSGTSPQATAERLCVVCTGSLAVGWGVRLSVWDSVMCYFDLC